MLTKDLYSTYCSATMHGQCVNMKTDGVHSGTKSTACIHTAPYRKQYPPASLIQLFLEGERD